VVKRVYLLQNRGRSPIVLGGFVAKTANAIGLLPPKKDMGNLQFKCGGCV
jgi:hypothetical protein